MYAMYLFLLLISVTSGDYLMTLIVLVLVPTCMYYVKILFELDNTSSVAVKTETFPNKRVPKAFIHKHIAQGCFSFQEFLIKGRQRLNIIMCFEFRHFHSNT